MEITSTFDALPGEELVTDWARQGVDFQAQGPFEFSLIMPRDVTHRALAAGDRETAREVTGRFDREVLDPLAGEGLLGAVVVHLPVGLAPTPEAIRTLQEALAALAERRVAIEAHDPRWLVHGVPIPAVAPLFASRDVTLVEGSGSPGERDLPPVGASHAYLRLPGSSIPSARPATHHLFSLAELEPWAERARDLDARGKEVRVIFANTAHAKGTRNALQFRERVGQRAAAPLPRLTEQRKLPI